MEKAELQRLRANPANWHSLGFFQCAQDPRVIVPKKNPLLGWTINIAHKSAWFAFLGVGVVACLPYLWIVHTGQFNSLNMVCTFLVSLVLVSGICVYFSSRH